MVRFAAGCRATGPVAAGGSVHGNGARRPTNKRCSSARCRADVRVDGGEFCLDLAVAFLKFLQAQL